MTEAMRLSVQKISALLSDKYVECWADHTGKVWVRLLDDRKAPSVRQVLTVRGYILDDQKTTESHFVVVNSADHVAPYDNQGGKPDD